MRSVYILTLCLYGFVAFGQMNTGELSGSVQDASKGLLPGAMIVAEHLETGQKFTRRKHSRRISVRATARRGIFLDCECGGFQASRVAAG